ncbi:MAG: FHA domain-containing protein [Pirellulaceae bacterium]|nr:FHA domain-containing protein [Pirellulaceae bacterium]
MLPTDHTPDDGPEPGWLPPLLIIDWGVEPRAGKDLTPEFHLVAPGYDGQPRVTAILDRRLDQQHWQQNPRLIERSESHWQFFQPLALTSGGQLCRCGQFLLEFQVVFPESRASEIRCFRACVRVTVPDASQSASPVLEIRADDSSLINLQGLDINRYAKIVVQGSQQGVVNVLHDAGTSSQAESSDTLPPDQRLVLQLPLEPFRELQRLIPWAGQPRWALPMDAASLVVEDGRRIHLLARERVVLGRDSSGAAPSDIMLRLFPLDDFRWTLTRLISRQHVRLTLDDAGLQLEDSGSTFGTYLGAQRLSGPRTIALPAAWQMQRTMICVAGVLGLRLTLHHDPGWDAWTPCGDTGETHYAAAAGCGIPPLWPRAAASHIDAVRIERCEQLPVADDLTVIESVLLPGHREQWEAVSRAAAAIEPIDHLAGRERYLLLYRSAAIGGSEEAAIWLPEGGLDGISARILNLGGRFWLESLASDTTTSLNGRSLGPRELIPLVPEDRVQIGRIEMRFTEFRQFQT